MKKLDEAGHTNIISLTQTRNGYYARVLDGNDEVQHIIIHPTEGTLSEKDVADLRRNRSDKVYRSHSSRVKKGPRGSQRPGSGYHRPHHNDQYGAHPHRGQHYGQHHGQSSKPHQRPGPGAQDQIGRASCRERGESTAAGRG